MADEDRELGHRKQQLKWLLYILTFIIFQAGTIVLFGFTVMKVRTPKFQVRSATVTVIDVRNSNTSFSIKMNTQLGLKNTNFGPFKYSNSTLSVNYRGTEVGSAIVPMSKAEFRRTKKIMVVMDLVTPISLSNKSDLASDMKSGILHLTSQCKLRGKVELMFILKKEKTIGFNCNMDLNVSAKLLQNLNCN